MVPTKLKSTFPPIQCAKPAAHSRIAAWKTSVPTTCRGAIRYSTIRNTAISVPLPAEVSPMTKPVVAPITTAATLWRVVSSNDSRSLLTICGMKSDRTSTSVPTTTRAIASIVNTVLSSESPYCRCSSSMTQTPVIEAGTLPTASHSASLRFTVLSRKCRHPPTVFVTAE